MEISLSHRHPALQVPEIAHLILKQCGLESITVSNILVCQVWLQVGLSIIWREVRDARRLLVLLGHSDPFVSLNHIHH